MRYSFAISIFLSSALIFTFTTPCDAAIARELSWKQVSDDGRHVLVMVSGKSVDEDASHLNAADAAEVRAIRAKYTQSGLYPNDGSTTPLWTIAYDTPCAAFIAPDGDHVAFHGYHFYTNIWLFYSKGQLLGVHKDTDVIPSLRMREMMRRDTIDIDCVMDRETLTLSAHSESGIEALFDMRTGAVMALPMSWKLPAAIGLAVLLIGVAAFVILRRRRSSTESTPTLADASTTHARP